jgi:hypothetical protein
LDGSSCPFITGITSLFTFHMRCNSVVRSLYFRIFSALLLLLLLLLLWTRRRRLRIKFGTEGNCIYYRESIIFHPSTTDVSIAWPDILTTQYRLLYRNNTKSKLHYHTCNANDIAIQGLGNHKASLAHRPHLCLHDLLQTVSSLFFSVF